MNKIIEITIGQQQALLVLIDLAVKANGLSVVQAALELAELIQNARVVETGSVETQ